MSNVALTPRSVVVYIGLFEVDPESGLPSVITQHGWQAVETTLPAADPSATVSIS